MLCTVTDLTDTIRAACARVAEQAKAVRIQPEGIPAYAGELPLRLVGAPGDALPGSREQRAAFWLTLDAINFGSGWFPTLRKRPGRSGYQTVAAGLRDHGPWDAFELQQLDAAQIAQALGQDPEHELMALFAASLRDLGAQVAQHDGRFEAVIDECTAVGLVERLADWPCFADSSTYDGLAVPFLKRAQIAAADVTRAGVADFGDLDRLTMFADNLVPHVLRLDGVLRFSDELESRIESGELIEHGAPEEVEIRACALHAVELIVAQRPGSRAADVDQVLWQRGRDPRYKARPRHRSRCTAY